MGRVPRNRRTSTDSIRPKKTRNSDRNRTIEWFRRTTGRENRYEWRGRPSFAPPALPPTPYGLRRYKTAGQARLRRRVQPATLAGQAGRPRVRPTATQCDVVRKERLDRRFHFALSRTTSQYISGKTRTIVRIGLLRRLAQRAKSSGALGRGTRPNCNRCNHPSRPQVGEQSPTILEAPLPCPYNHRGRLWNQDEIIRAVLPRAGHRVLPGRRHQGPS